MAEVRIEGARAYAQALVNMDLAKNPRVQSKVLTTLATETQTYAKQRAIIRGGAHKPHPSRLTSRTGTGRRSIRVNLGGLPQRAEVGSDLVYMALHETGGRVIRKPFLGKNATPFSAVKRRAHVAKYPRRAWLEPSVRAIVERAPDIAEAVWSEQARKAQGQS